MNALALSGEHGSGACTAAGNRPDHGNDFSVSGLRSIRRRTVVPSITMDSAMLARKLSPAALVSVSRESISETFSTTPDGIKELALFEAATRIAAGVLVRTRASASAALT